MRWPMQCIELDNAMQCMSHRNGMHGKAHVLSYWIYFFTMFLP